MKKAVCIIAALILLLALCACGMTNGASSGTYHGSAPYSGEAPSDSSGAARDEDGIISSNDTGTTVPNGTASPNSGAAGSMPKTSAP